MFLIAILNCLRLAGNTLLAGNRFHKETMRTGDACARALILASGYNSLRGCPRVEVLPANLKNMSKGILKTLQAIYCIVSFCWDVKELLTPSESIHKFTAQTSADAIADTISR